MKYKVSTKEKKFEPIKVEITLESEREAQALIQRLCSGNSSHSISGMQNVRNEIRKRL